jgi:hypothetical protein
MLFAATMVGVLALAQVPLWEPVWQLNRSTAANVCNRSDFIDILPGKSFIRYNGQWVVVCSVWWSP